MKHYSLLKMKTFILQKMASNIEKELVREYQYHCKNI